LSINEERKKIKNKKKIKKLKKWPRPNKGAKKDR
jgi:hypothetical protein